MALLLLALPFLQAGHGALLHHVARLFGRVLGYRVGVAMRLGLVLVELHLARDALPRHVDPLLLHRHRRLLQRRPRERLLLGQQLRRERALAHLLILLISHQFLCLLKLLLVLLVQHFVALLCRRFSRLPRHPFTFLVDGWLEAAVLQFYLLLCLFVELVVLLLLQ